MIADETGAERVSGLLWVPEISRPHIESALKDLPQFDFVTVTSGAEFSRTLGATEVLILAQQFQTDAIAQEIEAAPRLRLIQLVTAGYDSFERFPAPQHVQLSAAGEGLAPAVAEHAVSLLLSLGRRLSTTLELQARKRWDRSVKEQLFSLDGARVAVVGFGTIGQEIARRLRAFNAHVISITRSGRPNPLAREAHPVSALHEVLGDTDAVVLALPLSSASRGLFDKDAFAACKSGCLFVNVGRGELVEQDALVAALKDGHIGGGGLDVVNPEPLPSDSPLWEAPNVIITPHCAAGGGYPRLAKFVAENVHRYLVNEKLHGLV